MMTGWQGSAAWAAAGWTMLHFMWIGTLLGLVSWVGRSALRHAPANLRYSWCLVCLSLLAIAPVLLFVYELRPATAPADELQQVKGEDVVRGSMRVHAAGGEQQSAALEEDLAGTAHGRSHVSGWPVLDAAVRYAPWVWVTGTPATFVLIALGLMGANRLRQFGQPVTDGWVLDLCDRLCASLQITRHVALAFSDRVLSPVVFGVVRPLILLPVALITSCTPEQVELLLLHELAHVRRWDAGVNIAQRVLEALLFFHPAVWIVSRWVRVEREHCCDELVVRQTQRARAYAETLQLIASPAPIQMTVLAAAHHPLVGRIRHILQVEEQGRPVSAALFAGLGLLACCVLLLPAVWAATGERDLSSGPGAVALSGSRKPAGTAERSLQFPADVSLGDLYVSERVDADPEPYLATWRQNGWESFSPARGTVLVPAGKRVRLVVHSRSALENLSSLGALGPADLDELILSAWAAQGLDVEPALVSYIRNMTGLQALALEQVMVGEKGIAALINLPALKHLSVRIAQTKAAPAGGLKLLDNAGVAQIAALPGLETLVLASPEVTDEGLAVLARAPHLRELDIWASKATGQGLSKASGLRHLRLGGPMVNDESLHVLGTLASLRSLDVSGEKITDAGLAYLGALSQLQELSLNGGAITGDGLAHLKSLAASLKRLQISRSGANLPPLGDEAVGHLTQLKSLEHLSAFNAQFSDAGLLKMAALRKLVSLQLPTQTYVRSMPNRVQYTDAGVEALSRLENLEELMLGSPAITDQGAAYLVRLPRLKKLDLSSEQIGNAGLAELAKVQSLESLSLRVSQVTISGVNQLVTLTNLKELRVAFVRQDSAGLRLSPLINLQELTLAMRRGQGGSAMGSDAFLDEDVAGLAGLKNLRWLQGIRGITDTGMKHLSSLASLERLNVGGPGVTDAGLAFLSGLARLQNLTVSGRVTEAGLEHLESLDALRILNIQTEPALTPAAYERLQRHLPDLQVIDGARAFGAVAAG